MTTTEPGQRIYKTSEEERAKRRAKRDRKAERAKYEGATPGWTPGRKKESIAQAAMRQTEFLTKYPDWEQHIELESERVVITAYFGLDGKFPRTAEQTAKEAGLTSRQRAHQVVKEFIARMDVAKNPAPAPVAKEPKRLGRPPKEKAKVEEPPKRRGRPPKAKVEVE